MKSELSQYLETLDDFERIDCLNTSYVYFFSTLSMEEGMDLVELRLGKESGLYKRLEKFKNVLEEQQNSLELEKIEQKKVYPNLKKHAKTMDELLKEINALE